MDSIVSTALSEICSNGVKGISLTNLWPNLQNSISSSGLNLCNGVKISIWYRIIKTPGLEFKSNNNESTFDSEDPLIESYEEAEKLGLKIVAGEQLRDCFVGLYDRKVADSGISSTQRLALERLGSVRSDGITQSQLAKEFGIKGSNFFYIVRSLECQGLVVRQSSTVRTEEAGTEGEDGSKNTSIENTNLIRLIRYAKHLNSQQRLVITNREALGSLTSTNGSSSAKDFVAGNHVKEVRVKDYLPDLKAVCEKLEEADGKVLVSSDIKKALGYQKTTGHRTWRNICKRLKDARVVEEFHAEVNNKKGIKCLRLLKKFDQKHFESKSVSCGSDDLDIDQPAGCEKRDQLNELLFELPIEHQIHDMISSEGSKGLTVTEICKRVGLDNKSNGCRRLRNMFTRFGCHLQAESHNKSWHYRVWTSGNFTGGSLVDVPGKSANVVEEEKLPTQVSHNKSYVATLQLDSSTSKEELFSPRKIERRQVGLEPESSPLGNSPNKQTVVHGSKPQDLVSECNLARTGLHADPAETPSPYPCLSVVATIAQRERRILQRLQEEKFVLTVELRKWLDGLEKNKSTPIARRTLNRTLNKLQDEGCCKRIRYVVPDITNHRLMRTVEVVSIETLTPELKGQIPERFRAFNRKNRDQAIARLKIDKLAPILPGVKRIFSSTSSKLGSANSKSDSALIVEAMRANGLVFAKIDRAKLLHNFLWGYLSSSPDFDGALSSTRNWYDLENRHSTCKLLELNACIDKMPLDLYLQVVGSAYKFGDLIESCKCLCDLPVQVHKSVWDAQASARLARTINILRRLKLIRLVTDGHTEDAEVTTHATFTYAMELKPYIEEPFSKVPLLKSGNSVDLRPRIRHYFVLSNKEAVDLYWKTLERCYATADRRAAVHAFPGSAVPEVLYYSCNKGLSRLRFRRDSSYNRKQLRPEKSNSRSASRRRKKCTGVRTPVATCTEDPSPSTATLEEMQDHVGKRKRQSGPQSLPRKFLKVLNEGITDGKKVYESLAVANAVELLKLVFLNNSTASEVPMMLAEILKCYSNEELFEAFYYLKEKRILVCGKENPCSLSRSYLNRVLSSPFPINTGKRASKFTNWLSEREKDLMEEVIHLDADLQCGDIFHLLGLVSSGEFFISPHLPDEGVGEAEEKKNSKNKTHESEECDKKQVKHAMVKGEEYMCRREKGFPGLKVSLNRAVIPTTETMKLSYNEEINSANSAMLDDNDQIMYNELGISNKNVASSGESLWEAMTRYGQSLIAVKFNDQETSPLNPELFRTVHSTICKSGDQGLSMKELPQVTGEMAKLVVDVLEVFGLVLKVNAYNSVHIVDASYRSKYFLSSTGIHPQDLNSPCHMKFPDSGPQLENVENAETTMDLDNVHKKTILNVAKGTPQDSNEAQSHRNDNVRYQHNVQKEVDVSSERMKERDNVKCMNSGDSFRPILPWINGDGTTNSIVYTAITRNILGFVMQNPGVLEDNIIHRMRTLNPQSCRKLLELMVLDNHLIVKKMYQINTSNGSFPSSLQSLFKSSKNFKKPEPVYREHFFANPLSTSFL